MLSGNIYELLKSDLNTDKCYRGKDNWLFLGNSYDRCVDALTGKWTPSKNHLSNQVDFFTTVKNTVEATGAEFHILIGPNKSTIYPEYLPPLIFPAEERFISRLIKILEDCGISITDPTSYLITKKNENLLYYRSDTHWNNIGAKIALDYLLNKTRIATMPAVKFEIHQKYRGDLINIGGYKNFPIYKDDNFTASWTDSSHEPFIDKTVLVLGDSFSGALIYYLKGIYKHVYREHYGKIVKNITDIPNITAYINSLEKKPDIILWIQVERIFAHWGSQYNRHPLR